MALPLTLVVLALAGCAVGVGRGGFDAEHPRPDSLFYTLDHERQRALWASFDSEPDAWTSQYLGEGTLSSLSGFFANAVDLLTHPAPMIDQAPCELELVADEEREGARWVRLRVRPPEGARLVQLFLRSDVPIRSLALGEHRFDQPPSRRRGTDAFSWSLVYFAPSEEGFEIEVETGRGQSVRVEAVAEILGLPVLPGAQRAPRPPELRPTGSRPTDVTFIRSFQTF